MESRTFQIDAGAGRITRGRAGTPLIILILATPESSLSSLAFRRRLSRYAREIIR
jgi:hypothetical protein